MRTKSILPSILAAIILTSCGASSGLTNQFTTYGSQTNVVLQENNYRVIGQVSGTATDTYFLGFGGLKADLVSKAKQDMLAKAELNGGARAVIHMSLARHSAFYVFARTHTVTVTGTVIEFTK